MDVYYHVNESSCQSLTVDGLVKLSLKPIAAKVPTTSLSIKTDVIKLTNTYKGPSKRGVSARKAISSLTPLVNFNPKVLSINSLPSLSSDVSCLNTCQNCYKNQIESDEETKYVTFDNSGDNSNNKCEENDGKLVTCNHCKFYKYCNQNCYNKDWNKYHQYECAIFCKIFQDCKHENNRTVDTFTRQAIRLFIICALDSDYKERILDLTSHMESVEVSSQFPYIHNVTRKISKAIDSNYNQDLEMYILELLCIILVNFNTQMNTVKENIGVSLDPDFALINHSCIPNTIILPLNNSEYTLVSSLPIKAGKELYTNYVFTNAPKELRRLELKERFFFDCKCLLCEQSHDWFFSYNCSKCGSLFCSLSFDKFFSDDLLACLVFKNTEDNNCCSNCKKSIDLDKIKGTRRLHQILLANLFVREDTDNSKGNHIKIDKIRQQAETIIDEYKNFSGERLLEELISIQYSSYDIPISKAGALREVCDELIASGIIPGYCYPLSIYLQAFCACPFFTSVPLNDQHYKNHCKALNVLFSLQRRFQVDIPSDLTESRLISNINFRDTGNDLLDLAESLITNPSLPPILRNWITDIDKIIIILLKTACFFYLQAIDTYLKVSILFDDCNEVSALLKSINHIKYIILKQKIYPVPKELIEWYKKEPSNFTREMFDSHIKKLFDFVGVSFTYKNGNFRIVFADRNRLPIFKPFDQLTSKNMEDLQL